MKKLAGLLIAVLGAAPGISAQVLQTCVVPNPCGRIVAQAPVAVEWDGPSPWTPMNPIKPFPSPKPIVAVPVDSEISIQPVQDSVPLSSIVRNPQAYRKGVVTTRGILVDRCRSGMQGSHCFFLQDAQKADTMVWVQPWLPVQVVHVLPNQSGRPEMMLDLVGKYLEVRGNVQPLILASSMQEKYHFKVTDYRILARPGQAVRKFALEYRGFHKWVMIPDTNPPGGEMTLYVKTGEHIVLDLYKDLFPASSTSFDIDAFNVHAVFVGSGPEYQTVSFDADREGIFPITSHFSTQGGRIGLLIVQTKGRR